MTYPEITRTITKIKKADLALRQQLVDKGQLGESYDKEMEELHNKNAGILDEIIDAIGYPTPEKVGEEASEASWLIIQHSISRPDFMRKCAQLLENEVKAKKANPKNLAYLTDRIAVLEGNPQHYGTQFDWSEERQLSPNRVDNWAQVNERRKSIGLNTLEQQTEVIRKQARLENNVPPADFEKRKQEMDNWRQKVGWIK
ncbi:DUF6624 domain-containing protein [uncultured Marivirga sp.]|uniref:DUF6624 domain-containing protein n=1 Tax=uncultured Marivirga sp. TaxID=1123707 RepID=UPI0030EB9B3E|tara:strand:+ start:350824 stop:351423 length:600 start_codon:yes stop_codon:yes gene_type:complete